VQRDEVADVADQLHHAEDHRLRGAVLHALAVHLGPQRQCLRIGNLVLGHHPRTRRAERVAALALVPGAGTLDLEFALGHIVAHAIAGDVIHRGVLRHIARGLADDDAEFDFPVQLLRAARQLHVIIRTAQRAE
jgi:hypothetical protein